MDAFKLFMSNTQISTQLISITFGVQCTKYRSIQYRCSMWFVNYLPLILAQFLTHTKYPNVNMCSISCAGLMRAPFVDIFVVCSLKIYQNENSNFSCYLPDGRFRYLFVLYSNNVEIALYFAIYGPLK